MTLPRYRALRHYWRDHPPAHLLLAAWLGFGQPKRDLADLVQMFGVMPGGSTTIA